MPITPKTYFFCGIGGSGMSAIALALMAEGHIVKGSDRSRDRGQSPEKFEALAKAGAQLYPQDGSGIDSSVSVLVVSTAIEETIPDVQAALRLNIAIKKRAEILASLLKTKRGIAVGGTSGKSTVTGMLGHILSFNGLDPTVINGAAMMNALDEGAKGLGNAMMGRGNIIVIEADESDGSIALYEDDLWISVLNNITLDHKPIDQLRPLFENFVTKASEGTVVNLDDPEAQKMAGLNQNTLTFSTKNKSAILYADKITCSDFSSESRIVDNDAGETTTLSLKVPGLHNIENALAAIGAAKLAGVSLSDSVESLSTFKGVKRRLEFIGKENGITVIDDFAHNPDKVTASLSALHQTPGRLLLVFQPHGYGPMRLMRREMTEAFITGMATDDILIMPDILYVGGTAQKDISSADIIEDVQAGKRQAQYLPTRDMIREYIKSEAHPGDRIVIMGARDDTLTDFCKAILSDLRGT